MVQVSKANDLKGAAGAGLYRVLPEGTKIRLANGAVAQVTGNPGDGAWLMIRFLEHPKDPARVGQEDMVFFTDVENLA
jgi:hypothetical protein